MSLQTYFEDLLLRVGFDKPIINKHWETLNKTYSVKSRKYHNLTHLENML